MPPYLVPLDSSDLPALLNADASLYPSPLTLASLTSWTATAPYLSLKYVPSSTSKSPCGVCIVLPLLSRHWEALIRGNLKEWEITPDHIWSPSSPSAKGETVGLHVWHIERFESWKKEWSEENGFGTYCWKDVHNAVKFMLQSGCAGVIGYSGMQRPAVLPPYSSSEDPWPTGSKYVNSNLICSSLRNSCRGILISRKALLQGVAALQRADRDQRPLFRQNGDHRAKRLEIYAPQGRGNRKMQNASKVYLAIHLQVLAPSRNLCLLIHE